MFNLGIDQIGIQRALAEDVAANHDITIFNFQLFWIGHFVTEFKRFNCRFFQSFQIVCGKMVFDGVQRVRIAAIFQ
ncbi:Uncharacterised protein [Shigella sonnei]|nr:Uncharacterised protein [Shigella sonnei]